MNYNIEVHADFSTIKYAVYLIPTVFCDWLVGAAECCNFVSGFLITV